MRHFEQIVLVSEDGKTIIERQYSDGDPTTGRSDRTVEYWSIMTMTFQNGQGQGQAQHPFRVQVSDHVYQMDHLSEMRDEAFANFEGSFNAARPLAEENLRNQIEMSERRKRSQILLANAIPALQ